MITFCFTTPDDKIFDMTLDEDKINRYKSILFAYCIEQLGTEIPIPFTTSVVAIKYVENWINTDECKTVLHYSVLADIIKLVNFLGFKKFPIGVMNVKSILYNEYNIEYYRPTKDEYDECHKIKEELITVIKNNKEKNIGEIKLDSKYEMITTHICYPSHSNRFHRYVTYYKYNSYVYRIIENLHIDSKDENKYSYHSYNIKVYKNNDINILLLSNIVKHENYEYDDNISRENDDYITEVESLKDTSKDPCYDRTSSSGICVNVYHTIVKHKLYSLFNNNNEITSNDYDRMIKYLEFIKLISRN